MLVGMLVIVLGLGGCVTVGWDSNAGTESENFQLGEYVEVTGTIAEAGEVGAPYGTHALVGMGQEVLFSLRSNEVKLSKYAGQKVYARGRIIQNYPREDGPEYLQIESVTPFR